MDNFFELSWRVGSRINSLNLMIIYNTAYLRVIAIITSAKGVGVLPQKKFGPWLQKATVQPYLNVCGSYHKMMEQYFFEILFLM